MRCEMNGSPINSVVGVIPRASKSNQSKKAGKVILTKEIIEAYFGLKSSQAAKFLGISETTLKKVCRTLGIEKWPKSNRTNDHQKFHDPVSQSDSVDMAGFNLSLTTPYDDGVAWDGFVSTSTATLPYDDIPSEVLRQLGPVSQECRQAIAPQKKPDDQWASEIALPTVFSLFDPHTNAWPSLNVCLSAHSGASTVGASLSGGVSPFVPQSEESNSSHSNGNEPNGNLAKYDAPAEIESGGDDDLFEPLEASLGIDLQDGFIHDFLFNQNMNELV